MKRLACLLLVLFAVVSIASAQKKRVAVMNFDYATVHSNVLSLWGGYDQDIGKGIADLLVDKLVNDGQYSVIERKALDKILAEQNFSNSDRADPNVGGEARQSAGRRRHHHRQHHAVRA